MASNPTPTVPIPIEAKSNRSHGQKSTGDDSYADWCYRKSTPGEQEPVSPVTQCNPRNRGLFTYFRHGKLGMDEGKTQKAETADVFTLSGTGLIIGRCEQIRPAESLG